MSVVKRKGQPPCNGNTQRCTEQGMLGRPCIMSVLHTLTVLHSLIKPPQHQM